MSDKKNVTRKRVVVELDVDLVDGEWDDQTLLENLPDYLTHAVQEAERREAAKFPDRGPAPYTLDASDLTVWLNREDYVADVEEGKA